MAGARRKKAGAVSRYFLTRALPRMSGRSLLARLPGCRVLLADSPSRLLQGANSWRQLLPRPPPGFTKARVAVRAVASRASLPLTWFCGSFRCTLHAARPLVHRNRAGAVLGFG